MLLLLNVACSTEDDYEEVAKQTYDNGYLLINEGNFGSPNADVTYFSKDVNNVQNGIYKANNGEENLGDVLQTIVFDGDKAYLLLNNSNKIQVVNRYTFKKTAQITAQLDNPRYMAITNGMIYVSNDKYNGAKYVSVYKVSDLSFVKKINFTDTAERVLVAGGNVWVQNATYDFGNKFTKINTSTNEIDGQPITLPNGNIVKTVTSNNNMYTVTNGTANSYIYEINSAGSITKTTTLTGINNARNLQVEGGKYYFSSANKIYSMDMTATAVPASPIITAVDGGAYFTLYGFTVLDGKVFTTDVKNFTQDSEVSVYSSTGTFIKKFTSGRGSTTVYSN
jgi:hypothetical protein